MISQVITDQLEISVLTTSFDSLGGHFYVQDTPIDLT